MAGAIYELGNIW